MLHFHPQCRQHHACPPGAQVLFGAPHFLLGFRCGTPYGWRSPDDAEKMAMLSCERLPTKIPLIYAQTAA